VIGAVHGRVAVAVAGHVGEAVHAGAGLVARHGSGVDGVRVGLQVLARQPRRAPEEQERGAGRVLAAADQELVEPVACTTGATSPSQCKYDAFKADAGTDELPVVDGMKYYDANTNGRYDAGEAGIAGWQIAIEDHVDRYPTTDADGTFSVAVSPDDYTVRESSGGGTWVQTGNSVDQSGTSGGAIVVLDGDKTYDISVDMNDTVDGLYFGNVCVGAGGGLTLGWWSNKNGSAVMKGADNYAGSMAMLSALNLVSGNGAAYNPSGGTAGYNAFRTWLLGATSTNMAYMLSAQLATMELDVRWGYVRGGSYVQAPGVTGANAAGFMTVTDLMAAADAELALYPYTVASSAARTQEEALKTALDNANNNRTFVQAGASSCPTPVF
jgi:hypothetical protein